MEGGNERTLPTILEHQLTPFLEPIPVDGVAGIDDIKQYVVEQSLKSRNASALDDQQSGQGVCAGDADRQDLAEQQDEPEVFGFEILECRAP